MSIFSFAYLDVHCLCIYQNLVLFVSAALLELINALSLNMTSIKDNVLDLEDDIVNNTAAIKNNNAVIVTNADTISIIDAEVNNNNAIISDNSAAILSNANDITASNDFINHAADIAANMLEIAKHPGKQLLLLIISHCSRYLVQD